MSIRLKKENFAVSSLASGIGASDTSLTLITGQGARFPQGGPFRAVLWGANFESPASDPSREIVEATLSSGDAFTIIRGQEGTAACAWSASDNLALTITKGVLEEYEAEHSSQSLRLTQAESDMATVQSGMAQNSADIATLDARVDALEDFCGTLLSRTANQSIGHLSATKINWDAETYDTHSLHSTVTNNSRITIPAELDGKRVRLVAVVGFDINATGMRYAAMKKNNAHAMGLPRGTAAAHGLLYQRINLCSAPVVVASGDYFEVEVYQDSGGALNVMSSESWFSMEVIS